MINLGKDLDYKLKLFINQTGADKTALVKTWVAERLYQVAPDLQDVEIKTEPKKKGDARVKELVDFFSESWRLKRGGKYRWLKKDFGLIKHLLKSTNLDECKAACLRYFADDQPFILKNGHSFSLFVGRINVYVGEYKSDKQKFLES
jgi:hypothetical protein